MNLTKLTMRRPVSVLIILLALVVFGFGAITGAPLELIPPMEMPMLLVSTTYPGAGPEEVEELVSSVVEAACATMSGVEEVQSVSNENYSMVLLQFTYGTNMDSTRMDLQKKIDLYKSGLPEEAGDPVIIEMSMDAQADITLSVKATGDVDLLNYVENTIVPEFEKLASVASVEVSGGQKDYISVRLKEEQLNQFGLDLSTVANMIAAADFSMPAGSATRGDSKLNIRGGVEVTSTADLRQMPLILPTGGVIHLSDIADVYEAKATPTSISRYNGEDTVTIGIMKRQSAGTVNVCRDAVKVMKNINTQQIGVDIQVLSDNSEQIISAIKTVVQTLLLGILLSMIVLFVFFGDWRASLIVGSSMPISVFATLILMSGMGFSFNIISLGGLVIGVGMMVDNSIVVLESNFRHRAQRMSFEEAALEGTHVVTSSIVASTLTTIVVFLPISIMQGITGQLFKQLGFTIIFALTASLISALTLVPMLFLRVQPKEKEDLWVSRKLASMGESYGSFLQKTFKRKKTVVFVSIALLVLSFVCLAFINKELIPSIDQGIVQVSAEVRPGLKLSEVDKIAVSIEEMMKEHPDVERFSVNGSSSGVNATAYLKKDRKLSTDEVVQQWREETKDTVGYTISVGSFNMADAMSGGGDVQIMLQSTDKSNLEEAALQVLEMMRQHPSVVSASSSLTDGNPQAEIIIDPIKANASGLMPVQIMSSLSGIMDGKKASTIRQNGSDYEVRVEYPEDRFETVADLAGMSLTTPMGTQVPLLDIAEIRYTNAPQSIMKLNNQYLVTLTAQPTIAAKATASTDLTAAVNQMTLPAGVSMMRGFTSQAMLDEFSAMGTAIMAAVFLVFMVMAMQFESVKFSLVVMVCIPFSLIGSFGLLLLSRVTLSMPSLMGVLMLVGIVINNGILFIDTTNQLRRSMDAETALIYAGKTRMRPIFMTTLTTVLSMVPMALGIGEGSEIMQGMAVVIIGGLCASTILTLLLLPTFYLLVNDRKKKKKKRKGIFRRAEEQYEEPKEPAMAEFGTYDNAFVDLPDAPPETMS